jgi:uncharacterized protein YbjT (DUF2867 family)
MPERVLVTGATGYVGGRLVPHLLAAQVEVVCLVRNAQRFDRPFVGNVTVCEGSVDDAEAVRQAADGCVVAYFLVHSLDSKGFEQRDHELADGFRRGCEAAGVERIIYGATLAAGTVAVIELRAATIIGSGSASFEMLRWLTEVLPVMITPKWVNHTRCQPVSISDVLDALLRSRTRRVSGHVVWELGGPDVLTYHEMMDVYADVAGLKKRVVLGVPVLTPRLSSLWVGLVTPLPNTLARQLVGSLANDVVVTGIAAAEVLGLDTMSFRASVELAIAMIDDLEVPTVWSGNALDTLDATPDADDPRWAGGKVFEDVRVVASSASAASVYGVVTGIGGDHGWLWGRWLWRLRGLADKVVGGVGLRRGRRDPDHLRVGDTVDFWRVDKIEPDRLLRLRAEMRMPGYAWIEWRITDSGDPHRPTLLEQRARFVPRGVVGRLYWYAVVPFHWMLFPRLAAGIVAAAESGDVGSRRDVMSLGDRDRNRELF